MASVFGPSATQSPCGSIGEDNGICVPFSIYSATQSPSGPVEPLAKTMEFVCRSGFICGLIRPKLMKAMQTVISSLLMWHSISGKAITMLYEIQLPEYLVQLLCKGLGLTDGFCLNKTREGMMFAVFHKIKKTLAMISLVKNLHILVMVLWPHSVSMVHPAKPQAAPEHGVHLFPKRSTEPCTSFDLFVSVLSTASFQHFCKTTIGH